MSVTAIRFRQPWCIVLSPMQTIKDVKYETRRYEYADHDQRTRKRHYTFYRHDDGRICGGAAACQGRDFIRRKPLCSHGHIYDQHDLTLRRKRRLSLREPGRKTPSVFPQAGPYDDLRAHRRLLHAGMPDRAGRRRGLHPAGSGLGHRRRGHAGESLLDYLPQMVFFRHLYCHGMGMCACLRTVAGYTLCCRFLLAPGRRYHLHSRRNHLCAEASSV